MDDLPGLELKTTAATAVSPPFHRIVWPLAIAQTLVWAAMYYVFPALLLVWERDLGWPKATLAGAFTAALITSAILAPTIGRLIDRGHGTQVLTGSALLGAASLALLSQITAVWHFYAVWFLLGIAMSGSLYEACFALLTKTMGARRKQAITLVTLIAGFAGTLSFPGNNALVGLFGWRATMLVLASIVGIVALPLLWHGSRTAAAFGTPAVSTAPPLAQTSPTALRLIHNPTFWLLALGYAAIALNNGVLITHLLPLLDEQGIASATAVLTASMIGPMQVTGRLVMLAAERRLSSHIIFAACFIAMALAAVALRAAHALPALIALFVVLQGAGVGATSILRPVVTADLLGYKNFGAIAGWLALPYLGSTAAAPTLAALIWGIGGYDTVIWFAAGAAVVGLVAVFAAVNSAP